MHTIAELASIALASLQKLPGLVCAFRLHTPLLCACDEHRCVVRLQFGFLLESRNAHGISSRITDGAILGRSGRENKPATRPRKKRPPPSIRNGFSSISDR